jgi:hypothetical protein
MAIFVEALSYQGELFSGYDAMPINRYNVAPSTRVQILRGAEDGLHIGPVKRGWQIDGQGSSFFLQIKGAGEAIRRAKEHLTCYVVRGGYAQDQQGRNAAAEVLGAAKADARGRGDAARYFRLIGDAAAFAHQAGVGDAVDRHCRLRRGAAGAGCQDGCRHDFRVHASDPCARGSPIVVGMLRYDDNFSEVLVRAHAGKCVAQLCQAEHAVDRQRQLAAP